MNGYFYVLTTIDLFVLCFMCILTNLSEALDKKQKRGFFFAFALIAAISILEVITLVVDGTAEKYRWVNIVSNYLGFGLSPAVSICLVYVLDKKTIVEKNMKLAMIFQTGYLILLAASIPFGLVFSVSADNVYARGPFFCIYVIAYFAAILYLSLSTIKMSKQFQNRSKALIYPLIVFLAAETIIQVLLPDLHVTWLCVTLLSVLYFIYCNEMWTQLDGLTGLLNQNSYLNRKIECMTAMESLLYLMWMILNRSMIYMDIYKEMCAWQRLQTVLKKHMHNMDIVIVLVEMNSVYF